MSEWTEVPLADLARWFSGGTPDTSNDKYWGGDIPWISAASLKDFYITSSDRWVTAAGTVNGTRLVPRGSTIFVVRGMSLMSEFRIGLTQREVAFGQDCKALVPIEGVDPHFLVYAIQAQTRAILGMVDAAGHGTGRLQTDRISRLRVPMPLDQSVQRSTVALLRTLDDKIAVNGQISVTSDDLAAFLLRQTIAEDDKISDALLSEIALINQRKVAPAPNGYLRYVDISSVSPGRIAWPLRTPWTEAPSRARRGVSSGDTIWSTVRPGRRSYALILADDPELVVSTGFAVLTPVKVGPAFLYEVTKRDEFVQYLESVAEGSAYPAVRADRFEQATVPLLSPERLRAFEHAVMPLRHRANAAQAESRVLAELRDALLPKLMSGEIRVRDAERIVEDAT